MTRLELPPVRPMSLVHRCHRLLFALLLLTLTGCPDVTLVTTPPGVAVAPVPLVFPATRVGERSTETLTIFETSGRATLVIRAADLETADGTAFSIDAALPVTVEPGGQVGWTIHFQPDRTGPFEARLRLQVNSEDVALPEIVLRGEGLPPDEDGDGVSPDEGDCDDGDASSHQGAGEVCDGLDNDCDGVIDRPDAEESCNGLDDDCDGQIDEDAIDAGAWSTDGDGDGYGDESEVVYACDAPGGTIPVDEDAPGDCNDADPATFPGAEEVCDGADNDCDGVIDRPDAEESCNGLDDDCDGQVDEDAVDAGAWSTDGDGDGYGDEGGVVYACEAPEGTVPVETGQPQDCDDADPTTFPGAEEACDQIDRDCDGIWSPASCDGCHVIQGDAESLYASIQEALDAAALGVDFGGEIRVCAGTWYENLRFGGAPVVLRGVDPANTILDGSRCTRGASACSVVTFADGEEGTSGLAGLTLRGGKGTQRSAFQPGGSSSTAGGGLLVVDASPTLRDLRFQANTATDGGGIFVSGGSLTLASIALSGQVAQQSGGGLYALDASVDASDLTVTGHQVNHRGAGIYLERAPSARFSGLHLSGNVAAGEGGGLYALDSRLELIGPEVRDNRTSAPSGGGLRIDGGSIRIDGGLFTGNQVPGGNERQGGGAVSLRGVTSSSLHGTALTGNSSAGYGGALAIVESGEVLLEGLVVRENQASSFGGALHLYDTEAVTIEGGTWRDNRARSGGGLWGVQAALSIRHTLWTGNSAVEHGAAVYLEQGEIEALNNLFLVNTAQRQGGGLYLASVTGQVVNNTLVKNTGGEKASGVMLSGSGAPSILNNIISHGQGSGTGIEGPAALASLFQYNDLYPGTIAGFTADSSNISQDPQFVTAISSASGDPATWDLHLKASSACINRGNSGAGYNDPDGSRNDIGAYGGPGGGW